MYPESDISSCTCWGGGPPLSVPRVADDDETHHLAEEGLGLDAFTCFRFLLCCFEEDADWLVCRLCRVNGFNFNALHTAATMDRTIPGCTLEVAVGRDGIRVVVVVAFRWSRRQRESFVDVYGCIQSNVFGSQ